MAEKNKDEDDLNLELPSLSLRRKRKDKAAAEPEEPVPSDQAEPAPMPAPAPSPYVPEPEEAAPVRTEKSKPVKSPTSARPRRELTMPAIPGMTAATVTGVLVGILACGATWLALQGCQAIRGTSSCGGPGFVLLLAILIGLVLLGSALLKVFRVPDSGSTSFLAVGLMAVLVLLFLVDVLFDWWMIIVIPVVAAATFALSHWVTARFSEAGDVEG